MFFLFIFEHLSWLDISSVIFTFATIAFVQLLNEYLLLTKPTPNQSTQEQITETSTKNSPSQQENLNTNGKLQKQIFKAFSEDASVSATSSHHSSARNSINSSNTTSFPQLLSSDPVCDEYHEDEDTLSLDNLFPCDQSEIHASKKFSFIIDELIQTEKNYVNNLRKGYGNYGNLSGRQDAPVTLQGEEKRFELFGNIDEIIALHEKQILPMMLRNQRDLKQMFDDFSRYFDDNKFNCYVTFTMNKKDSLRLRQEHRDWLTTLQYEFNDKLGIDSFLVQPIQRLTRYPLLLQQFISELYKAGINCKPVLMSVCKLETRIRRFIEVVNQAEEVRSIDEINDPYLLSQGIFRGYAEVDAYQHRLRKKYRAKVFIFDHCLICTEVRKKRLAYRCHYDWHSIELLQNSSKHITVSSKVINTLSSEVLNEELELYAMDASSMTRWLRCAQKTSEWARITTAENGKLTLPMEMVLAVLLAIWLICRFIN